MPSRLSMNVTTGKQSQGMTFGEKVAGGLQAGGGKRVAAGNGGSPSLLVDCEPAACSILFPDGSGYRADLQALALAPLEPGQVEAARNPAPAASAAGRRNSVVGQGASLVGAAMPGAGIVSAAVSSVGSLAGAGGGAAAASYAATGRSAGAQAAAAEVDLSQPLADGDYQLTVVVEKATQGLKDTLKTQVRSAAPPQPQQVRIVLGFNVENGVLKARHDTAKNSIGNIR